jgi:hypothetical protein
MTESRRVFLVCPCCGMITPYVYTFTKAKHVILENREINCEKCKEKFTGKINLQSGYLKVG